MNVQTVLVSISVVREIQDVSEETVIGNWNGGYNDKLLDRIIVEDVQIANDFTNNAYNYRLKIPGQENPKVLGEIT